MAVDVAPVGFAFQEHRIAFGVFQEHSVSQDDGRFVHLEFLCLKLISLL